MIHPHSVISSIFQEKMQRDCYMPYPIKNISTFPPFPLQDWIYQQVLSVGEPLHPVLPPLLQEFVTSILLSGISARTASGYHSGHSNSHGQYVLTAGGQDQYIKQ